MRLAVLLSIAVSVMLLLAACGGSATTAAPPPTSTPEFENSPEGAVKKILVAIENQNANQYLDALDPGLRNEPNFLFQNALARGIQSYLGLDKVGDLNQVSFRDLQFSTLDSDGKNAHVSVSGKVRNITLAVEYDLEGSFFTRRISGSWYVSSPDMALPMTEAGLRVIPVSLTKAPARGGWVYYVLDLVLENPTDQYIINPAFSAKDVTVNTSEGARYPGVMCQWKVGEDLKCADPGLQGLPQVVVPPHFRIRGMNSNYMTGYIQYNITFRAAEAAHPSTIDVPGVGTLQLGDLPRSWRTVDPARSAEFAMVGDVIRVHDSYEFTVKGLSQEVDYRGQYETRVSVVYKNLNTFQETMTRLSFLFLHPEGFLENAKYYPDTYPPRQLGPGQGGFAQPVVYRTDSAPVNYLIVLGDVNRVVALQAVEAP